MKTTAMPLSHSSITWRMISTFAATSMPRVGSSRMSMRGSVAIQRARSAFCWLPPESCAMGISMSPALMPNAAM